MGKPTLRHVKGRATYLTYRGLSGALQMVPSPAAPVIATVAGRVMSELWRSKRPLLRRNLRRVLGPGVSDAELERMVVEAFDSYARYWVEASRCALASDEDFWAAWSVEGREHLAAAMDAGNGVIVALPHVGNWEYGGRWLGLEGWPMTTVAEVLEPPELFGWFVEQRSKLGLEILGLGQGTSATLAKVLRQGRLVGLLADRDLNGTGVEVEFFGEVTTLPAGPATLALRTGATLMTSAIYDRPHGTHHAVINPPIDCTRHGRLRDDIQRVTRAIAAELEVLIGAAPEQWHIFQPNWPSDREPRLRPGASEP